MANYSWSDVQEISGEDIIPVQLNPNDHIDSSFRYDGNYPPHPHHPPPPPPPHHPPPPPPPPPWYVPFEFRATSSSRSHSEAEKRRRDRINEQLATLRRLIPKSDKMDKAALLGSAVEKLKEMKSRTMEIGKVIMIPSDVDEVTVDEYCPNLNSTDNDHFRLLKASISCEDRPEFFSEMNGALKSLRLSIVHAEMISVGGRIKSIFILCGGGDENDLVSVKQSLRVALSRIVTSCSSAPTNFRIRSRRQRIFLPVDH